MTEDEFEISEAVVAAEQEVVAEKENRRGVGQRLGQDRKIDAANARPERQVPEHVGEESRHEKHHRERKGETRKRLPKRRELRPAEKNQEIGNGFMILP